MKVFQFDMKYVYGIVWKNITLNGELRGLQDSRPVQAIEFRDIAALTSDFDITSTSTHFDDLKMLRHDFVVNRYFLVTTILPFRFGTVLKDMDRVQEMIRENYLTFRKNLVFLRDKVEFGLKAIWSTEKQKEILLNHKSVDLEELFPASPGPGVSFLMKKYQETSVSLIYEKYTDEIIHRIDQTLSKLSSASKVQRFPITRMFMDAVYLVDKEKSLRFQKRVKGLDAEAKILLTGPWPPYNFVNESFT